MLKAISPIDGRYASKTRVLSPFFSEESLIYHRVVVEIEYFLALFDLPIPQFEDFPPEGASQLIELLETFDEDQALRVKEIESQTNHDVKAVEYYLKEEFEAMGLGPWKEFIHFGLTSQDINNTAMPLMIQSALKEVYTPQMESLIQSLNSLSAQWMNVPMLARTHGQPASPTTLGKELLVFVYRLREQIESCQKIPLAAKFGGATGNFNAHAVAYPDIDWPTFADTLLNERFGLKRSKVTTQIENYDHLAALFHNLARINTILIDFCRDMWTYISMEYFRQKVVPGEVGSSAMPHKVNPIDFENAEGNLGIANALYAHFAEKLPVSRLQRDLTDSTVSRNIGVPFAHTLIAMTSIQKGLQKVILNEEKIRADLEANWSVVAEAIQTILRREGYPEPYEALKALTRGRTAIDREAIRVFIDSLKVSKAVREELHRITPWTYTGVLPSQD
jgi:adenylosuccinate lyase